MVDSFHGPKGKEIHDAFTQQIFIKHIQCPRQCKRQQLRHVDKICHLFCAFKNKNLKQLKESFHHYSDEPQKKCNHLYSRFKVTQVFQDPKFSGECYRLTGSSASVWFDMRCTGRHANLKWRASSQTVPYWPDKRSGSRRQATSSSAQLWITLSKLAPHLWFSVPRVPSK